MATIKAPLLESLKVIQPEETMEQSLAKVLKAQAEEKLRHFESVAEYFRKRYKMSSKEFYKRRIQNQRHSWDEEDTYFDWATAEEMVAAMKREIRKLEKFLSHANRPKAAK